MTVETDTLQANVGEIVTLFKLDTTVIGGEQVFYFVEGAKVDGEIVFQGQAYQPIDVEAEGFEWNGQGQAPQPSLRVSNVLNVLGAAILELNDLLGAEVTRLRTFAKYLDGQPTADPNQYFEPDVFRVEQKKEHNKFYILFALSSVIDQQGRYLPSRQVLRDVCTHVYRRWDSVAEEFTYEKATCPYQGSSYFNRQGSAVQSNQDVCGKRLSDCKLRFDGENLPYRGFPGVARFRI